MAAPDSAPILAALHAALILERVALRIADFAGLAGLAQQKEALTEQLIAAQPPDASALELLRTTALRNHMLMISAIGGVRSAQRRFKSLQSAQISLNIYDRLGRRQEIMRSTTGVERRA